MSNLSATQRSFSASKIREIRLLFSYGFNATEVADMMLIHRVTVERYRKRMNVGWQDCEYGAPEIDPKRPYGNSNVEDDILEILGWKKGSKITVDGVDYDLEEDDWEIPEVLSAKLRKFHEETATALQLCLTMREFKVGKFARPNAWSEWKRVKA